MVGEGGSRRGTNKTPVRKRGDGEASLYSAPVTEQGRPLPSCLGLWPLQNVDKWHRVSESYKNDDKAGGSDL